MVVRTGVGKNTGDVRSPPISTGIFSVVPDIMVTMVVITGPKYGVPMAVLKVLTLLLPEENDRKLPADEDPETNAVVIGLGEVAEFLESEADPVPLTLEEFRPVCSDAVVNKMDPERDRSLMTPLLE
jgi:hypothetical protein